MASRVKGIVVEIGGDTTGLNKALQGTNSQIHNTQSSLKDVERLLKLDPTNTTLLAQKQRLLGDAVSQTKEKLATLKEAEKQVQQQFEKGETSQEQYDMLQREIIATEQSLKKLNDQAAESNKTISKVGAAADAFSNAANKVAEKTAKISTAAAVGVTGMVALAVSTGATADDLNTLAKQSGFSTEQLQIWQYGADRVDVAMEDIVSSAQKMKKNMISTSAQVTEAWSTLGISVVDANGELRDSNTVFDEAVAALSKVENETERDTLAMTLFGKSADSLAGLLDDGGAAFRQYGDEAKAAGLILSQDALDSANKFNDAVDTLKAQATGTFAEIGGEIATMLIPIMEDVGNVASSMIAWIKGLDESQLKMIITILALVAAISPVAKILSGIGAATKALSIAFSFLAANPIVLIIAAVAALVAGFVVLWNKCEGFRNFWINLWTGIKNTTKTVINGIMGGIESFINGIIGGFNYLIRALNKISFTIPDWVPDIGGKTLGFNLPEADMVSLPKLASGGEVLRGSAIVGEAGPELLTVAQGRTIVQPLSHNTTNHNSTNLGGVSITVYGAPGQDVHALAEIVMEEMQTVYDRKAVAL